MMSISRKKIFSFLYILAFSTSSYAEVTHPVPQPYVAFSVIYGSFQDGAAGTGNTTAARIAAGSLWKFNQHIALGGEVGAQSGNRMRLSNNVAAAFGYTSASPIDLTIKPPVDILAAINYHFGSPFSLHAKAGAVYLRTMTDSVNIPSESEWLPEIQIGAGYDLTSRTRILFSYQHFFGQSPTLNNVNPLTGTATLNHVPGWQAGILSFEADL